MEHAKQILGRAGLVGGVMGTLTMVSFMLAGAANAADGDATIDAQFTDLQSKVVTYGGAMVALAVVGIGLTLGLKYLRKAVSKA